MLMVTPLSFVQKATASKLYQKMQTDSDHTKVAEKKTDQVPHQILGWMLLMSSTGQYAPLFITVSGLNDRELPPDNDLVVLKIPGLCMT